MKIGINASFLAKPTTGIGQVTVNFLQKLTTFPTENLQFILYCQETPKLDFELPAHFGVRVFLPWWKRDDVPRQWLWEKQVAREAVKDGCDVFFSLYQSATVFPSSSKMRHVMFVHDLIPKLFPAYLGKWTNRLHYKNVLEGIRRATHILTPSLATKEDVVKHLRVAPDTITVTPLGVDSIFFERLTATSLKATLDRYGLTPGYVYHGGGLEIRKNTEAVLRAYAKLVAEKTEDLPRLVVSGKIYPETNTLATPVERLIRELHLVGRVKLLGLVPKEDLPALYQGASMFLFPSRYEGFGLPVLEAFASGTPVITTQAGSLKELAQETTALLIKEGDQAEGEIKRHIHELLMQRKDPTSMSDAALKQARMYRWEKFAQQVVRTLLLQ